MAKFVISQNRSGEYQFDFVADNGEVLLRSEGYFTKSACLSGVESFRKNSKDRNRFISLRSINGSYYYHLKAGNGQILSTSEKYSSQVSMDNSISKVMRQAEGAEVFDKR